MPSTVPLPSQNQNRRKPGQRLLLPPRLSSSLALVGLVGLVGLLNLVGPVDAHADDATSSNTPSEIYRGFYTMPQPAKTPATTAPVAATSSATTSSALPPYPENVTSLAQPPRKTAPLATVIDETPDQEPRRLFQDDNDFQQLPSRTAPHADQVYPANHLQEQGDFQEPQKFPAQKDFSSPLEIQKTEATQTLPPPGAGLPLSDLSHARPSSSGSTQDAKGTAQTGISLRGKGEKSSKGKQAGGFVPMLITMGGALLLVIGLFLLFAWLMRRTSARTGGRLPSGVLEVLGHQPITGRQQVHLLRLGRRLLLISVMPDSIETLTEITDPVEVDRIAGLCHQSGTGSSTGVFQAVMQQFTQGSGQAPDQPPTVEQLRQRIGS